MDSQTSLSIRMSLKSYLHMRRPVGRPLATTCCCPTGTSETEGGNTLKTKKVWRMMIPCFYCTANCFFKMSIACSKLSLDIACTTLCPLFYSHSPSQSDCNSRKNVSWSINGSSKPEKSGKAILQMWQLQNLQKSVESSDASSTQRNLSLTSQTSSVTGSPEMSRRSSALTGTTTLFSGSSATSVIAGSRGNGIAVILPEPPVLVFFTVHEGKYAYLHLERMHLPILFL